jgi:hypothetical protein
MVLRGGEMSSGKAPDATLTVAQSLKQVRWDYHPEAAAESNMSVAAGTFFHEFPWDGEGEDRAEDE